MDALKYKTYVITVTYGNRFEYLEKVIEASFRNGVEKIIVVDNGSHEKSRIALSNLAERKHNSILVIHLRHNLGSAGGYKAGLKIAYELSNSEYIWLLDDDNVPAANALSELHKAYQKNDLCHTDLAALFSLRPKGRRHFEKLANGFPQSHVFPRRSSFRHIHIIDLFGGGRIHGAVGKKRTNGASGAICVPYAPYGGLFFHKGVLEKIGYPNEKFYLYADDREFSYRITRQGGYIYLIPSSRIDDIHLSNHNKYERKNSYIELLEEKSNFEKTYYLIRNSIFFQRHYWTDSIIIYTINKVLFFLRLFYFALYKGKIKRFLEIVRAVKEGEKGRLGLRKSPGK